MGKLGVREEGDGKENGIDIMMIPVREIIDPTKREQGTIRGGVTIPDEGTRMIARDRNEDEGVIQVMIVLGKGSAGDGSCFITQERMPSTKS
mmetsp:Transcript_55705/g.118491  ORF Transcript_55705/g.118491 Transcript_55705/m.118491 type:complete len:92 (+) Transcript_55705:537-812(+)